MTQTSHSNHLPEKCQKCAKSSKSFIHGKCNLCNDLQFQEEIFCDLNRSIQHFASFECHAFQPILKLVQPSRQNIVTLPSGSQDHAVTANRQKLLNSDKIKYQRALALQKLAREPGSMLMNIRYHFAWNVIYRKQVFRQSEKMVDFLSETFFNYSELVGSFVGLLCLAPDHLHLYVESDGEKSAETIAQQMKLLSVAPILSEFAELMAISNVEKNLWDKAYFVETVG